MGPVWERVMKRNARPSLDGGVCAWARLWSPQLCWRGAACVCKPEGYAPCGARSGCVASGLGLIPAGCFLAVLIFRWAVLASTGVYAANVTSVWTCGAIEGSLVCCARSSSRDGPGARHRTQR